MTVSPVTQLEALPEAWERLPEESDRAFAAFVIYRDLPAAERSIPRAVEVADGKTSGKRRAKPGNRERTYERFSSAHYWTARARQYDDMLNREAVLAEIEARRAMGREHAKAADALVTKALLALDKLNVEEMSAHEIVRFVDVGVKLGRLVRGEDVPADDPGDVEAPQDTILALLTSDPEVAKAGARFGAQVLRVRREREEEQS